MSSFNSSEMKDPIAMVFLDVMYEAMSILQAEEVVAAIASVNKTVEASSMLHQL
jgi:hypothetical protein